MNIMAGSRESSFVQDFRSIDLRALAVEAATGNLNGLNVQFTEPVLMPSELISKLYFGQYPDEYTYTYSSFYSSHN